MKLKLDKELNSEETKPAPPEAVEDMMYGMKTDPSNNAADAIPKEESERLPDTSSIRSCSMTPFAACVFCSGTIVNCDMLDVPCRLEPAQDHRQMLKSE